MKLTSARSIPLLITLLTMTIVVGINGSDWFRLIDHNETMLNFARQMISDETSQSFNQEVWLTIASQLKQETLLAPDDAVLHSRLASAYTAAGNTQESLQYASKALSLAGHPHACYVDSEDFTRWITTPHQTLPRTALPFDHPQAYWHIVTNNGGTHRLFATETAEGCEITIDADIELAPFRYFMLVQELILTPNTTYRLSADIQSSGISRAWLGTFFTSPGQNILPSDNWQYIAFEFTTKNDAQYDRVHLLIDEGHGILSIRNVKLEMIQ